MSGMNLGGVLNEEEKKQFHQDGFLIKKSLFQQEAPEIAQHFMDLHARGPIPDCFDPLTEEAAAGDILKRYPRMMHPHKIDTLSMSLMLDRRVIDVLADLFNEEPIATQSMFYFKPPGARGQALHQDNYYLRVSPGTCIAAWTALDVTDEDNGGLFVVPRTNQAEIQCPHPADLTMSFTDQEVDVPEGLSPIPILMQAGDVLFFNGSLIHGSYPNRSKDRFRRSFICHYAGISTQQISEYYKSIYRYNQEKIEVEWNPWGGPCGTEETVAVH